MRFALPFSQGAVSRRADRSIIPLIAVFIVLQRYWKLDLISGSLKG
ncbi:ABC-type maltose transport system permease subunit [Microbacterium sp. W4I4]|nr:ABC-type maltose transport system permease subunit [Microbacterium sp. W4I4]